MLISIEISLYPLQDNHIEIIDEFIQSLSIYQDIKCEVGQMSTIISGDAEIIFRILKEETTKIFEKSSSVLNVKISNCCCENCLIENH